MFSQDILKYHYWFVGALLIIAGILVLYPEIDIIVSGLFFKPREGFFLAKKPLVKFLYSIVPIMTKLTTALCVIGVTYKLLKYRNFKLAIRSSFMYLLLAAILGPGIIVNSYFKNYFGRARPATIQEFQGTKTFTGPFVISNECNKNCSFTSGHAAMAFYFTAIAYLVPFSLNYIAYALGVLFGVMVGFARIAQGGHFLSDVFFSALFVLYINHILYKFIFQSKVLKLDK